MLCKISQELRALEEPRPTDKNTAPHHGLQPLEVLAQVESSTADPDPYFQRE
jgi:hypothetical protein